MRFKRSVIYAQIILIAVALMLVVSGCSNSMLSGSKQKMTPKGSKQANAVYYDFEDILVPKEMKIDNSSTVVVSTPGQTSGIITLKGRIDKTSLLKFFNSNMQKDNWNIVSQIRSPAATILVFQKVSRCAVITLRDREYYTYAEIGVAPSVGQPSSGGIMSIPSDSNSGSGFTGNQSTIESEGNLFD
ncbi:MAG: hypothetical protein HQK62_13475 [Desulfamplus sp.]|nr:hypothetical protein [Desulfamplus sp.]MBF0259819.1 hypothetical protein [Desulfamplus sp.]